MHALCRSRRTEHMCLTAEVAPIAEPTENGEKGDISDEQNLAFTFLVALEVRLKKWFPPLHVSQPPAAATRKPPNAPSAIPTPPPRLRMQEPNAYPETF